MQSTEPHERIHGHADDRLVFALEPDQTIAEASRSLPRYRIGKATNMVLWGLRIFVLIMTVMVVYTFAISLEPTP